MVLKHFANNVHINPRFLMSHFICHLSNTSCDVVKLQNPKQLQVRGDCRYMMAKYGCLQTSGPAVFVNINAYHWQIKTQKLILFGDFIIPFHASKSI